MIKINANQLQLAEAITRGTPDKITKIMVSALNRVSAGVKTDVGKKVKEKYTIKTGDVQKSMIIRLATTTRLSAIIRAEGRPTPLSKFKIKAGRPLYIQVKKGGGGVSRRAFLVAKTEQARVFARVGKSRYPIKQRYGPSIPQMVGNKDHIAAIEKQAQIRLDKRFEHELNRYLGSVKL